MCDARVCLEHGLQLVGRCYACHVCLKNHVVALIKGQRVCSSGRASRGLEGRQAWDVANQAWLMATAARRFMELVLPAGNEFLQLCLASDTNAPVFNDDAAQLSHLALLADACRVLNFASCRGRFILAACVRR